MLDWALEFLECHRGMTDDELKEQYHWFVRTYHPDRLITGDRRVFQQTIQAWKTIKEWRKSL